jgi:hypothetical protein
MGIRKNKAHVIDHKAIAILKLMYEDMDWSIFDLSPDYGLDQVIEVVEGGKHSGKAILVQVKGRGNLPGKGEKIKQPLEIEHLDYYTKRIEPVFLIVVDVKRQEGYWVFLQKYVKTELRYREWRPGASSQLGKKPEITINVPASNRLSDRKRFKSAIEDALGYMKRLSISDGIIYNQQALHKLDPRFDIRMTATEKGESVFAKSNSEVQIDFLFSEDFLASSRHYDLLGRGLPVSIAPGEFKLEGSLLLETVLDEVASKGGVVRLTHSYEGYVNIEHVDKDGHSIGRFETIPCHYEGGISECRFHAEVPLGLISLRGTFRSHQPYADNIDINYHLAPWANKPLLGLPSFEGVHGLLGNVNDGDRLLFQFYLDDGSQVNKGHIQWGHPQIQQISGLVDLIFMARWIARKYERNRKLPLPFDDLQQNEILAIYHLDHGGEISQPALDREVRGLIPRDDVEGFIRSTGSKPEPMRLTHEGDVEMSFLGVPLPVGRVHAQFSHMVLKDNPEEIRKRAESGIEAIPVTWVATPESKLLYLGRNDGNIIPLDEPSALSTETTSSDS